METFLWGLVKSIPTPTQHAARYLTHPVLTLVLLPQPGHFYFESQFHFYCPCGLLEQTWLAGSHPSRTAAPPLVP